MLRSTKSLIGYNLEARDGEIGRCHDFLVDGRTWNLRYLVVDTRKWLPGRKVVIVPAAIGKPDWSGKRFPVDLTREQIESSPPLAEHAPVSLEYEAWCHQHYGWPHFANGLGVAGAPLHPGKPVAPPVIEESEEPELDNPHLHSLERMSQYLATACDRGSGRVEDFIFEDRVWTIRYLIMATRVWLPGRKVRLPIARVKRIHWRDEVLALNMTGQEIAASPEFHADQPVNTRTETRRFDFEGRPVD